MKQSKRISLLESTINIVVGFGISLGAQMIFLPMLGVPINHAQNFVFACIMTVISLARSFLLRRLFEALHIRTPLSPFMLAVIAERRRQVEAEGWSIDHDDKHPEGELAKAGGCYATHSIGWKRTPPMLWPWSRRWWKPADFRRNLVKGAALVIAEGEKFDRLKSKSTRARPMVTDDHSSNPSRRLESNEGAA